MKLVTPEPPVNTAPPVEAAYQSIVDPDGGIADNRTGPAPQRDPAVPVGAASALNAIVALAVVAAVHEPLVNTAL